MSTRTKRPLSEQAQAAKAIRQGLKKVWPTVKFSVTSESFAGGDAVHITWTDGPTHKQVEYFVSKYEAGTFDGMTDMYEYDNVREDIPQAKYVQTQRSYSPDAMLAAIQYVNKRFGWFLVPIDHPEETRGKYTQKRYVSIDPVSDQYEHGDWQSSRVHRALMKMSLVCIACDAHTLPGDAYCAECGAQTHQDTE